MRLFRCLLVLSSAAVAAGSLMLGGEVAATTAAAPVSAVHPTANQQSARFLARARTALIGYLGTSHPLVGLVRPGIPDSRLAGTSESSYNWSGYADVSSTNGAFTEVSGHWKTPRVRCSKEDEISSAWVGIDGYNSPTAEQDGTISWCFEHEPTYFTWYEMYPAGSVKVGAAVRPGDEITAKVTRSGTSYTLALTDSTHPVNSFSVTSTCALTTCLATSAEWIAERPAFAIGVAPLADYAHWALDDATETAGGHQGTISGQSPAKINMIDATNTYALSTASGLTHGGSAFTTHWHNSY